MAGLIAVVKSFLPLRHLATLNTETVRTKSASVTLVQGKIFSYQTLFPGENQLNQIQIQIEATKAFSPVKKNTLLYRFNSLSAVL